MKSLYFLVVTCLLFVTTTSAQRNYNDSYSRIGLQGGLTIFGIKTDNFNTNSAEGFKAGLTTRGAFYNNFDLIYGLNFYDLNANIKARETVASQERDVEFGIFGVQLNLLASYNIIEQHLSIEAGPALLINSKLTTNEQYENYIIDGYTTLTAKEIEDISKINGPIGLPINAQTPSEIAVSIMAEIISSLRNQKDTLKELRENWNNR